MVILINGASSVGKTSVCAELHRLLPHFVYFETDKHLDMLGAGWFNFERSRIKKLSKTIPSIIKTIAGAGNDIIYDAHIPEAEELKWEIDTIGSGIVSIYLKTSAKTLQQREILRNDRPIGCAIASFERFTSGNGHDFIIDTTKKTPLELANQILDIIK